MRIFVLFPLLIGLYLFPILHAELFSVLAGTAVLAGTGVFVAFKDTLKCKVYECCDYPYINPNFPVLSHQLKELVFGQHIVLQNVVGALETHWNGQPKKPLVMSFHGFTGCGKNYVASIIAQNLFRNGMKSRFVHHLVATAEFSDKSRMAEYQEILQQRLISAAASCERALFIIDEIDKMPERLLNVMKPFMDYHHSVKGVDFRRSIFILLSNKGAEDILRISLAHHAAGRDRESLELKDFEGRVAHDTFNREGGLRMSEIISNHLIDHYIPFLPLERSHVEQCIASYFDRNAQHKLAKDKQKVKLVADELKYFPADNPIYSSSGCKRVGAKSDLIIARARISQAVLVNLDHDDL